MNNNEKYLNVFVDALGISAEQTTGLEYNSISAWDSVGHMRLINAIEDAFDIMVDTDDIIDLSSFEKGKEILSKNYNIEF